MGRTGDVRVLARPPSGGWKRRDSRTGALALGLLGANVLGKASFRTSVMCLAASPQNSTFALKN